MKLVRLFWSRFSGRQILDMKSFPRSPRLIALTPNHEGVLLHLFGEALLTISDETMVTNHSVEALPGVAEIRRTAGTYSLYQQGAYVPEDGVDRWMGSIATDHQGNMLLGYRKVNGVDAYRESVTPVG